MQTRTFLGYFTSLLILLTACSSTESHAQSKTGKQRYCTGLTATGSENAAFTIYTNPAENSSTCMNISWATQPGKVCEIEVTNEADGSIVTYQVDEPQLCKTFDNINSKLGNNKDVVEKHVFDKYGYELFGLQPDTDYSYRIITYDPDTDTEETSDTYRFRTAGADSWKAAVIGDFHHYSPIWSRLDSAMGMLDVLDSVSGGYDMVISTGDQTAWGGSYNFWTELSEQPQYKNHMWASVQGNHDQMTRNSVKTDNFFRDSHFFPRNGYPGQEGISYWFRYGDVLFIMLNNEALLKSGSLEPCLNWMENVIKDNPSRYVVVVEHHQWLIGTNGGNSQLDRFRKAFDRLGVDLALSGHNHAYLRTYPLYDRKPVKPEEGTYYVVNSSSDNNRGRALVPLAANKDIIAKRWSEGANTVGAMIMDVNPERIEMTLYDRNGKVQDNFTVPAKEKNPSLSPNQ